MTDGFRAVHSEFRMGGISPFPLVGALGGWGTRVQLGVFVCDEKKSKNIKYKLHFGYLTTNSSILLTNPAKSYLIWDGGARPWGRGTIP